MNLHFINLAQFLLSPEELFCPNQSFATTFSVLVNQGFGYVGNEPSLSSAGGV